MSKSREAKKMGTHWRYADAPKKFKWWFARIEWRRAKRKLQANRRDDNDRSFNRMLTRYGLGHLQIIRLENRDMILYSSEKIND